MGEWRITKILEAAFVQGGFAFKSKDYSDDGIPLYRISNVGKGKFDAKSIIYLPNYFFEEYSNFIVNEHDILIGLTGDVGKVFKVKKQESQALLNQRVGRFILNTDKITTDYLFYIITSSQFQNNLSLFFSGGAQANISPKQIHSIEIKIPTSLTEQTRIAQILSKADEAIAHTESLIGKYQRIKTGLMQDLLTRGIDENGTIRSEETHEFKDSPLGRIPVEWEVSTLGAEAELITSGSRGWAKYYSSDGFLFLRIGNLTRKHINFRLEDIQRVILPANNEGKRTLLSEGDILISITADLGIIGVIPKRFEKAYINQHIALVRISKSSINPRFIGYFLSSQNTQNQLTMSNDSGAKAGLNLSTISRILFYCPDIYEQDRIASLLDKNNDTVESFKRSLAKLQSLKRGLMQDLLSGPRETAENE